MILIVDGVDAVGKDTQIKLLKKNTDRIFHELHYTADIVKNEYENDTSKYISKIYYDEMFNIFEFCEEKDIDMICNRSHLGEYVYGDMYRGYSGDYIFDIEKKYKHITDNIYLVVLVDDAENLLKREDGESLSANKSDELELKNNELKRFEEVFDKTIIKNKIFINIKNKTPEEVHSEIMKFLYKDY